ncbi:hypothetical protein RF11_02631 [Thelohanellus kitauei]|uniref:Uncharacterized protein n=1 Tax=Thelohanellus kitauei TaxID=669202 RepID=A0A0C2IR13_THEKT|nr:hypothetical protein RF11_02631 [Thelohanellus kitauei]
MPSQLNVRQLFSYGLGIFSGYRLNHYTIKKAHSKILTDDPELLARLPSVLANIKKDISKFTKYPDYPYKYCSQYEMERLKLKHGKYFILDQASSTTNHYQYLLDRSFELANLPKLPIENSVSSKLRNEAISDHMKLKYDLEGLPKNKKVRRYMDAVVEGLRGNRYLKLQAKKKRLKFFKHFFSQLDLTPDTSKEKVHP